jgi:hypothetical protein
LLPLTLLPWLSPPATHIPFPYFTVRIVPSEFTAGFWITVDVFVVQDNPPSYENAIRFVPPPAAASRITAPPTAIKKFREYVCDHLVPSAPLLDLTITDVVSAPPPGSKPCARPTPPRHIAPAPAPDPALVGIPVVKSEIGIFANATAFVHKVGVNNAVVVEEFHSVAALTSIVLARRENPAPDVTIHEYPVHAIPFNRPNVGFVSVPVEGFFHSDDPFNVVVYAIWFPLFPGRSSPTTTQIGVVTPAPTFVAMALLVDIIGGIPPLVPDTVAAAHPVAKSSAPVGSARHEILPPEISVPTRPPPQQIHAVPLYPTEVIRIAGRTDAPTPVVVTGRHPVAPVLSLV